MSIRFYTWLCSLHACNNNNTNYYYYSATAHNLVHLNDLIICKDSTLENYSPFTTESDQGWLANMFKDWQQCIIIFKFTVQEPEESSDVSSISISISIIGYRIEGYVSLWKTWS